MLGTFGGMKARDPIGDHEIDAAWTVALKILRYLLDNPHAADTANGILEWWLLKQSIWEQQSVVERALDALVERNLVLAVTSADGRKHYHLNADRVSEGRRLIGKSDDQES
jgi:hypothetical protein